LRDSVGEHTSASWVTGVDSASFIVIADNWGVSASELLSGSILNAFCVITSIIRETGRLAGLLANASTIFGSISLATSAGLVASCDLAFGSQVILLCKACAIIISVAELEASFSDVLSEWEYAAS